VHVLGTALFTIAVVAGQSGGGLVVDRVGVGPAGPQATTPPRIAGAVLMFGAVVLSVAPSVSTDAPVALALLPLVAGVAIATQQGLNGRPRPLPSEWYLYLGGPVGAVFIGLSAWIVGQIGVLLLSLGAVAGQIVGALVLDVVVPSAAGAPGVSTVLGAALTLVAAAVAAAPWPVRRPAGADR
jgi:transporter family-2 protein